MRSLQLATFTALLRSTTHAYSTTPNICTAMTSTPSIKVIPNDRLYVSEPDPRWFGNGPNPASDPSWTNLNWLKSRFHFGFAEYSNPKNSAFGVLRVLNDDLVQPHRGFGTHPHRDMEIITYVVQGELTHQDSMGTSESLGRGSIQFMTAGTGVEHSEFNKGDKPLRFIQVWIVPATRGVKPNYGSMRGQFDLQKNQLRHLVSNVNDAITSTPAEINQDVDAFASEIELGKKVFYDLPSGRQAYLLCVEGSIQVNGKSLFKHDACEILTDGPGRLELEATGTEKTENGELAHILLFTMKSVPNSGRTDF
jgi:redox-sensitive bicupin YhaK (pirin superfamily)